MFNNHVVEEILAYIKQQETSGKRVASRRAPNPRMVFILGVVLATTWVML